MAEPTTASSADEARVRRPLPLGWLALPILLVLGAILFFFQTRDPMILMMAVQAAIWIVAIGFAVILGLRWLETRPHAAAPAQPDVRVRCPSCRHLNPEDARFCSACGNPV